MLGVSTDRRATQARFKESCGLPYPLICGGGLAIVKSYGFKLPFLPLSKRRTVVISSDGTIRATFKGKESMDPGPALALCRSLKAPSPEKSA